jgi:putative heme-binding domain-containing protein
MRAFLLSLPLLLATGVLLAQRDAKIPDPDPEVERKTFKVADGFEVNLFAADPQLAKPIHMNFDAAGRLWLACSETYPQIKPGQKANDKIIVLEDTKGVGKADKVTVFADGLLIPTGLEPGDGGVYVANSTELLHLSASKPGAKADRRRVILSGFGTEDTHHLLHTLRWGHDGNLYMNQAVYIHSHIETPYGVRRLNAGGVWQFRPDTRKLEVFTRGMWNSWGHHFDRFGQSFQTDGAGGQGVYVSFPGAAYDPAPGAARVLQGLNPGSPKYCGLEIVSGSHLPDDWQGSLITCDFRAHRVCRFTLAPSGSGYTSRLMPDVIKATHPAFRPIDVKQGPDGAIYVADWYNPIIQHGEVDFRDPRRDVTHGRIWRITAKNRKVIERPKLTEATAEGLAKHLESPEAWTRHFARRQLKERFGDKAAPSLEKWLATLDAKKADHEPHRLEGLWAYQTIDVVEPALLGSLLEAKDARVRAAAVRVLGAWHGRVERPLDLLERRVADEHPQVRLEAVRALSLVGGKRSAQIALGALDRPRDTNLDYGLWLTLRELESAWLPALTAGEFEFGSVDRLSFALQAVDSDKVVKPLVNLLKSDKLSKANEDAALVLLAGVGGPGELALVLDRATAKGATPDRRARLLAALEASARQRNSKPAGSLESIASLVEARDPAAARLAGLWRVEKARAALTAQADDDKASAELRQAAIDGLAGLGGAASKATLTRLVDKGMPSVRRRALIALAGFDLDAAAARAADVLSTLKDGVGAEDVYAAFLQRKGGAAALTKVIGSQKLPADVARVGVRTVRISGREAPGLAEALTKAGGLTFGAKVLDAGQLKEMVADVAARGDAARGEAIFRRADLLCLKCHAIGGAGGQVGPDLSSIGAVAQVDYLVESLLLPSKAIKEGYHSMLVTTKRGRQLTGIRVRETPTTLVLRDDQDKEIVIPIKEIDEKAIGKVSLMPEGLTDTLTRAEMLDLVRFLSELGKSERWSVGRTRVARRWEVLRPTKAAYDVYFRQGVGLLATNPAGLSWEPTYSTVSGSLPLAGLPALRPGKDGPPTVIVQARLEATATAKVRLKLSTKGLSAWLDGDPVSGADVLTVDLKPGGHTLTFAVTPGERIDGLLRVEIEDGPASAAVRFAGGK